MAQIMLFPLNSVCNSRGLISIKNPGFSPTGKCSHAKAVVREDRKTLQSFRIAHKERKFNPNHEKPDYVHSFSTFQEAPLEDMGKRINKLVAEIKGLFNSMEDGEISPSAYDTAWVARIPAIDGSIHKWHSNP